MHMGQCCSAGTWPAAGWPEGNDVQHLLPDQATLGSGLQPGTPPTFAGLPTLTALMPLAPRPSSKLSTAALVPAVASSGPMAWRRAALPLAVATSTAIMASSVRVLPVPALHCIALHRACQASTYQLGTGQRLSSCWGDRRCLPGLDPPGASRVAGSTRSAGQRLSSRGGSRFRDEI
jgi:hypothetical protein